MSPRSGAAGDTPHAYWLAPADEAHGVVLQAIRHTRMADKGGRVGKAPADEAHGVVLQAIRHTRIAHKGGWVGKAFGADSKISRPPTSVSNKGHTLQTQDVQLSHEGLSDMTAKQLNHKLLKTLKIIIFEIASQARVPFVKRVE